MRVRLGLKPVPGLSGTRNGGCSVQDRLDRPAATTATATCDDLPRRSSDFATLGEALDYAARGKRGLNFHDPRGMLARAYPFAELREDALAMA